MAKKPILNATRLPDDEKAALYQTLTEWHELTTRIAADAAKEKAMRLKIADTYFKGAEEGTNTILLDFGKELKLDVRISRKLDKAEMEAAHAASVNAAALGTEVPAGVIPLDAWEGLINYDPKVSVSTWKAMDKDTKLLFGNIITEEPGTPGLAIHTPKKS